MAETQQEHDGGVDTIQQNRSEAKHEDLSGQESFNTAGHQRTETVKTVQSSVSAQRNVEGGQGPAGVVAPQGGSNAHQTPAVQRPEESHRQEEASSRVQEVQADSQVSQATEESRKTSVAPKKTVAHMDEIPSVVVPEVPELKRSKIFTGVLTLVISIYGLLVSLDLLSAAFKLIGGRTAGWALSDSKFLKNPIVGLMTGVLVTVLIQSSSSSTSLTVSMVGSNYGLELLSAKFLLLIVDKGGVQNAKFLSVLTKPLVKLIVRIDKKTIELITLGDPTAKNRTILLDCCKRNGTECLKKCMSLFNLLDLGDTMTGILCFLLSLISILFAFYFMVKVLTSLTRSRLVRVLTRFINKDFQFPMSVLVGYLSIALGCGITFIFQSSSAFTSALLPFAALGLLDLTRVYPLTLGSNVGTTATGLIAAMAGSPLHRANAIQIALCHTFFNVIGILIFYPLPFLRVPIYLANRMGTTSARYRWFVLLYLLVMFFLFPMTVLLLSLLGDFILVSTLCTAILLFFMILLINVLQDKHPLVLPPILQTWDFLPIWMRSLRPMDKFFTAHLENIQCLQIFLNECSYIT